jgi:hypothetical protein
MIFEFKKGTFCFRHYNSFVKTLYEQIIYQKINL